MVQTLLIQTLCCCLVLPQLVAAVSLTVSTQYGDIMGLTVTYPNAPGAMKSVNRFLGIPYASQPVNELRLKRPQPPTPWKPNVLNATKHGKICTQSPEFEPTVKLITDDFSYGEDCLVLDIYTTNVTQNAPVIVYIHGGGYRIGTSIIFPGDGLALFDVVVVVIQYRLGPFGFTTTGDSAAPGNFGMLDQVAALQWVQDNIQHFGGDTNKVTILGESAGGTSVCLHLLSPLSDGLFHQAIAESGVDYSRFAFQPMSNGVRNTKLLAKSLGCDDTDSEKMVACFREKEASDILAAGNSIYPPNSDHLAWSPVLDKYFLPDTPQNLRKEGKFKKVNFMVSFNSDEGTFSIVPYLQLLGLASDADNGVSRDVFEAFLSKTSHARESRNENADLIADATEFMYLPWPDTENQYELRRKLGDSLGDFYYVAPSHEVAAIHSNFATVFMYEFAHRSKKASTDPEWMGVTHGVNVVYDFGIPLLIGNPYDEVDANVSVFIMTAYAIFAKSGNPTPLPGGAEWQPFNTTHSSYLFIDANPKQKINFHPRRMAFWNEYYPKLSEVKFTTEVQVKSGAGFGCTVALFYPILLFFMFWFN